MYTYIYIYIYPCDSNNFTIAPAKKDPIFRGSPIVQPQLVGLFFFVGDGQMNGSTVFGVEVDMEEGLFMLNLSENVTCFRKGWLLGNRYGTWCPARKKMSWFTNSS